MKDMYHFNQIPSEAQIRKYVRRIVFGKSVFCPVCRSRRVVKYEARYRCRICCVKFSLLSPTWLRDMKIPYQKFWMILWCWTIQEPVLQAMSWTGLSEDAVRRWYGRFRAHLPQETHILEHIVQMDEAYFKDTALLMAKQKGTRKLAWDVIRGIAPNRSHAAHFIFRKVKPRSKLWTDGGAIYNGIGKWWPVEHQRDIHKKFEFTHTSEIEGIFGNYRTFVRRMYHHHWSINLDEYVREFCFRFSSPELFENPIYYLQKTLTRCTN